MALIGNNPGLQASSQYQHDVFISYSFGDEGVARRWHERLAGEYKTFFAPVDLPEEIQKQARFQYANILMDGLVRSCHFVGLLSASYMSSAWCQLEMMGFFNLLKNDRTRRMWLCPVERSYPRLNAHLHDLILEGDEGETLESIRRELAASSRQRGDQLPFPPPKCLRPLPLREIYTPPKRAPWGLESHSRGLPGAPPYDVYENMVREYMVQIKRGHNVGALEIPVDRIDERYQYLSDRARADAEYFLSQSVDPFTDRKPYSEHCWELMVLMGAQGESEFNLRGMAECRSFMGPDSFPEAISIAKRAVAEGADISHYRRIRGRSHYGLREYQEAIETITTDQGPLFAEDYLLLAASHAQLGQMVAAGQAASRAIEIEPGFSCFNERINTLRESDDDIEHWIWVLTVIEITQANLQRLTDIFSNLVSSNSLS